MDIVGVKGEGEKVEMTCFAGGAGKNTVF